MASRAYGASAGNRRAQAARGAIAGAGLRVFGRTLAAATLTLLSVALAHGAECPGNPRALGTSRVMTIDPTEYPRIGHIQYQQSLPLRDREVVLTFDDGPLPPYTNRILEVLAGECVKANYFIIGRMARGYPDLLRRIHAEGHVIGTHTQNHPLAFDTMPLPAIKSEIEQGIASVAAALGNAGAVAPFFRIPGLLRANSVEKYVRSRELTLWSADFTGDDWRHITAAEVAQRVMTRLNEKGRGIILLHDIQPATALALPEILRQLKRGGYKIVQVVPAGYNGPAVAARNPPPVPSAEAADEPMRVGSASAAPEPTPLPPARPTVAAAPGAPVPVASRAPAPVAPLRTAEVTGTTPAARPPREDTAASPQPPPAPPLPPAVLADVSARPLPPPFPTTLSRPQSPEPKAPPPVRPAASAPVAPPAVRPVAAEPAPPPYVRAPAHLVAAPPPYVTAQSAPPRPVAPAAPAVAPAEAEPVPASLPPAAPEVAAEPAARAPVAQDEPAPAPAVVAAVVTPPAPTPIDPRIVAAPEVTLAPAPVAEPPAIASPPPPAVPEPLDTPLVTATVPRADDTDTLAPAIEAPAPVVAAAPEPVTPAPVPSLVPTPVAPVVAAAAPPQGLVIEAVIVVPHPAPAGARPPEPAMPFAPMLKPAQSVAVSAKLFASPM